MARRFRRVVTGHDEQGRSTILFDGEAPNLMVSPTEPLVAMTDLWRTTSAPASNHGVKDAAVGSITLPPPKCGTVFRMVELPPDKLRNYANLKAVDSEGARVGGHRHPGFHRTNSLDYIIVIEGEVWALLDTGETLMHSGDVLIQRGTSHAWSNRSEKRVVLAGIMIDAEPTL